MGAEHFFDTTILIYSLAQDDPRGVVSDELLAEGGTISVQTLNEFAAVSRRKLRLSWGEVAESLSAIRTLCGSPKPITVETHDRALKIAERYGFQIYDALIVASAIEAGCRILYSEDMQDGQRIESLTIRNPFLKR